MSVNFMGVGGGELPLGYIFEFDPTGITDAPDLSTAAKVRDYFGYGTWEAYGAGRVMLSVSDDYTIGSEGGEARHILTEYEMPNHSHMTAKGERSASASQLMDQYQTYQAESTIVPGHYWVAYTMASGGGHSHNNMQPYRAVYRWRRIA